MIPKPKLERMTEVPFKEEKVKKSKITAMSSKWTARQVQTHTLFTLK